MILKLLPVNYKTIHDRIQNTTGQTQTLRSTEAFYENDFAISSET